MATRIQIRGGTAAQWTTANPVLSEREMGIETDTRKFKFGDGSSAWDTLAYASAESSGVVESVTGEYVDNTDTTNPVIVGIDEAIQTAIESITVSTDDSTIQGDGTPENPISLKNVFVDGDTITGSGTEEDPLVVTASAGGAVLAVNNGSDFENPSEVVQNIGALERETTYSTKTDTDHTLALSDFSVLTEGLFSSASAHVLNVPLNSNVAIPVGRKYFFRRLGAGRLTITPLGGVTINSSSGGFLDAGLNRLNSLEKTATDTWYLDNGGVSASINQVSLSSVVLTITNIAAGFVEISTAAGRYRTKFDFSPYTQIRFIAGVSTAGNSTSGFWCQYSTDQSSWSEFGTGSGTNIASFATGTSGSVSDWITIPSGALADVWVRGGYGGGDGAADPVVGLLAFQVR